MVSPLALLNQSSYDARRRGGVTYMPPVRLPPPTRPGPPITNIRAGLASNVGRTPRDAWVAPNLEVIAANQARQAAAQQQAAGGGGAGGLGWLVGGLGKAGMGALSALDYPRATVNALISEVVPEIIQRMPDAGNYPALDTNFSWGDIGQNIQQHKGFGETLVEPIMGPEGGDWNIWVRRAMGLGGDIATDPFTYLLPGTKAITGLEARSGYLNKLLSSQQAAAREATARQAAKTGFEAWAGAAPPPSGYAALFGPEARAAVAQPLIGEAERGLAAATARGQALGTLEDIERMGRRGINLGSPEQLAEMGVGQHAIRAGLGRGAVPLPGTEGISAAMSRMMGPVKEAVSGLPGMAGMRGLRTPRGPLRQDLRAAMEKMVTGKGAMTTEEALRTMSLAQLQRQARGAFRGPAVRVVQNFAKEVAEYTPEQRAALIRQAEEEGVDNIMTTVAPKMLEAARQAGADIPEFTKGRYVVPHVLSRDAFNWLNKLRKGEDPLVEGFKSVAKITDQDLLEEGGFLQRRIFTPGTTHKIGDREITIETGSLAELEDKLGGLLRERGFKGQLYETDPVEAWKRYVNATERDVAKRYSARVGAERGYPGLAKVGKEPGYWDPYGGRQKLPPTGEPDEAARYMVTENRRPKPEDTEFFEMKPHKGRTAKRNKAIAGRKSDQRKILAETVEAGNAEREMTATQLEDVAKQAYEPIGAAKQAALQEETAALTRVLTAMQRGEALNLKRADYQGAIDALDNRIRSLRGEIGGLTSGVSRRAKRINREQLTRLQDELDRAIETRDAITDAFRKAQTRDITQAEQAKQLADSYRERAIEGGYDEAGNYQIGERARLETAERAARANRGDALYRARQEIERRIASKREGARVISEREYENSISRLKHLWNNTKAANEYRRLDAEIKRVSAARAKTIDKITSWEQGVKDLTAQIKQRDLAPRIREQLTARRNMMEEAAEAAQRRADNMQAQITELRTQINQHEITKLSVVKNMYEDQEARIARFTGETGERGARRYVDVPAAESRWAAAKRSVDEFEQALVEESRRAAPTEDLPKTLLNEAEQAELAAARKALAGPRARDFAVASEQRGRVEQAAAKAQAELERLQQAGPETVTAEMPKWTSAKRGVHTMQAGDQTVKIENLRGREWSVTYGDAAEPDSIWPTLTQAKQAVENTVREQLPKTVSPKAQRAWNKAVREQKGIVKRAEDKLNEIYAELQRSTRTSNKVTRAQETVQRLEAEDARRLAAAAAERQPTSRRLPFFENLDVEQRRMYERAQDLAAREQETSAFFTPRAVQAEEDVTKAYQAYTGTMRGAEQAVTEAREAAVPFADMKRDQIEQLAKTKDAYQKIDESIAQELGQTHQQYTEALRDQADARARHDDIAAKAEGLRKPVSPTRILEESKKGGAPSKADIKRVLEGDKLAYEVQPLNRTIVDVRKVIDANPTGDDALVNRIEAALSTHEQALAQLTTDTDIKAYQLNDIIQQANKGELAPVLKGQLRSAYRYVWEGGDIVVRKDLERMYFNVAEQLDSKLFGRTFTAFTNFFKTYATLTPGFHVRNAISAIFMNASEGVTMAENLRALRLWREYAKSDDPLAWLARRSQAEQDAFRATFASGAGGQFTEAGVSELATGGARFMERVYANRLTKGSQRLGQDWVEGPVRLALALNTTMPRRVGGRMVPGGSLEMALHRVTRIHFDYAQVSKFDESMKRIIPFWTFMSRNIPLQFTQMWTKPKMYLRYQSFARNMTLGAPDVPFLPEYIEMAGGLAPGAETPDWLPGAAEGMPLVLQPGLPHLQMQEDLRRLGAALSGENKGQIFSDFNPLLTTLPEYALGKDFFTGKTYGPEDVTQAKGLNLPLGVLLTLVGGAEKGPDGNIYIKDEALNAVRGLNPILDRQMRLLPQLSGGEGGDRQFESLIRFLGAPVRTISEDQTRAEAANQYYRARDARRKQVAMGG